MSVAIVSMVRNEAPYLLEWLTFHSLQGVTLFRIYDNESDDGTLELLQRLSGSFPIELVRWPREGGVTRQAAAFNDALESLRGRVTFAGFIDSDEFLFDPLFRPLPEVLADFDPEIGAIGVNQTLFGSSGHERASDDPVTSRFVCRAPDEYSEHEWFKSIARLDAVETFDTQHAVRLRSGYYVLGDGTPFEIAGQHPGHANRVARDGLRLHHYMLKSLEEFRRKQLRGAVSDRPADGYRRLDDAYFYKRQEHTNTARDETLLALESKLRETMAVAATKCAPAPMRPLMTPTEIDLLSSFMRASDHYLEFGTGGSTVLACSTVRQSVVSVDCSIEWRCRVLDACWGKEIRPELHHVDIGPIGTWGFPLDPCRKSDWPHYYKDVWPRSPDLVLVDGRFRVACFVTAALACPAGTALLIHDFDRKEYQAVHRVGREIARAGSMSAFVRKETLDLTAALDVLREHEFDPR